MLESGGWNEMLNDVTEIERRRRIDERGRGGMEERREERIQQRNRLRRI